MALADSNAFAHPGPDEPITTSSLLAQHLMVLEYVSTELHDLEARTDAHGAESLAAIRLLLDLQAGKLRRTMPPCQGPERGEAAGMAAEDGFGAGRPVAPACDNR